MECEASAKSCLRAQAKSLRTGTQLASLKQVSAVLQRSHPRAKRKPDPRIMHSCPDAHRRRRYCWCEVVGN
ncbi:hypothetical protein DW181_10010 [Clostridium sp. AM16-23]|nr:hypothetical protein DW181_10010 [Clostridium sp. AM16-23]